MTNQKGAPPSNPQIIARRRQHVLALRLRGYTLHQIQAVLGDDPETHNPNTGEPWSYGIIQNDLKVLEERWQKEAVAEISERKAFVAAQLEELKKDAWSRGALVTVLRAIERECRLFGLDSPVKIAPTDPSGGREFGTDSEEEARAKVARILMKIGRVPNGQGPHGPPEEQVSGGDLAPPGGIPDGG